MGLGSLDASVTSLDVTLSWRQPDGKVAETSLKLKPNAWHTVVLGNGKEQQR